MLQAALVAAIVSLSVVVPAMSSLAASGASLSTPKNSVVNRLSTVPGAVVSMALEAPRTPPADTRPIPDMIARYASKYGVPRGVMQAIVECEDPALDPLQQSEARYTFSDPARGIRKGERERSFGLAQIHLPDHSGITLEQATDPDFSLDFMAREIAAGHRSMWTC